MQKQYNTPATEILSLSPAGIICASVPNRSISSNVELHSNYIEGDAGGAF